jgi:hypothetical protein
VLRKLHFFRLVRAIATLTDRTTLGQCAAAVPAMINPTRERALTVIVAVGRVDLVQ